MSSLTFINMQNLVCPSEDACGIDFMKFVVVKKKINYAAFALCFDVDRKWY